MLETEATTECPGCGAEIVVGQRFVTWCPACDWNVDPPPARKLSRGKQRAADASVKVSRDLFDEVSGGGAEKAGRFSVSLAGVAALLHAITAAMIGTGVALLARGFGKLTAPVRAIFGSIAVAVGIYLQPFRSAPRSRRKWSQQLTREAAPSLYALADEIARELDAPGVDSICFSTRYASSLAQRSNTGWTLTLGLGLWSVLSPEERVALLAHEIGHQVNRDQRRSWLVRTAADAAGRWSRMLVPRAEHPAVFTLERVAGTTGFIAMLPFSLAARGLSERLAVLSTRQGQGAEYYADQLAVKVAGSEAVRNLIEKSMLAAIYDRELTRSVRFRDPRSPWDDLADYAAEIPELERERQRRVGRLRLTGVDPTHPPTQLRADVIAGQPAVAATVTLANARAEDIAAEVDSIKDDATAVMRAALRGAGAIERPSIAL